MADYELPGDWSLEPSMRPLSEQLDWSQKFMGIPSLLRQTMGEGIIIAFLDTGVDETHPDLKGQILDVADFTGSMYGARDVLGHGTWVTGCCVANSKNDWGISGLCSSAKALCYKVMSENGRGNDQMLIKGIERAGERGAHIISFSGGGPVLPDTVRDAAKQFIKAGGRFLFAAAGNDGRPNSVNKPAAWPEWIPIGACNEKGELTDFTSRGPELTSRGIVCPGYEMISTAPGGGFARMSGTSMACPTAAGVAALLLARDAQTPQVVTIKNQEDMRELMRGSATTKTTGPESFALINPEAAMKRLDAPSPKEQQVWHGPGGIRIIWPAASGSTMEIDLPRGPLSEMLTAALEDHIQAA